MPDRIPVSAAKKLAEEQDCRQVIVLAWDGERTHIVTYGKSVDDCDQAAQGGNMIKEHLSWPESTHANPSRVEQLLALLHEINDKLQAAQPHMNGVHFVHSIEFGTVRVAEIKAMAKRWTRKKAVQS